MRKFLKFGNNSRRRMPLGCGRCPEGMEGIMWSVEGRRWIGRIRSVGMGDDMQDKENRRPDGEDRRRSEEGRK